MNIVNGKIDLCSSVGHGMQKVLEAVYIRYEVEFFLTFEYRSPRSVWQAL